MLIDTHSHIYDEAFGSDREEAVNRCVDRGIKRILLPATDRESYENLFAACKDFPNVCYPMMGLHPTSVNENPQYEKDLETVAQYLAEPPDGIRFYGIGETGLDMHWSTGYLDEQTAAFKFQIELALEYDIPVVIHTRSAWPLMRDVLAGYRGMGLKGVMHSFSGSPDDYLYIKECGNFLFGIGGPVTYKNSGIAAVLKEMDIRDIVLETDSPYLPPVPHRGERNEPAYLIYICEKVSEIKGMAPEKVAETTSVNAVSLFGL